MNGTDFLDTLLSQIRMAFEAKDTEIAAQRARIVELEAALEDAQRQNSEPSDDDEIHPTHKMGAIWTEPLEGGVEISRQACSVCKCEQRWDDKNMRVSDYLYDRCQGHPVEDE